MKKIKRGDIYLADMNPAIGSEQGGVRPVLIIQNNKGNKYSPTTIVACLTSRVHTKANLPTHYLLPDDIKEIYLPVALHRVKLSQRAKAAGTDLGESLLSSLSSVVVPKISGQANAKR